MKKFKYIGVALLVLLLIYSFLVFTPKIAEKVIASPEVRSNVAKVVVALIAIVLMWVFAILAIPILLKIGLIIALGLVVYFAFRGLFKKSQPQDETNGEFKP